VGEAGDDRIRVKGERVWVEYEGEWKLLRKGVSLYRAGLLC